MHPIRCCAVCHPSRRFDKWIKFCKIGRYYLIGENRLICLSMSRFEMALQSRGHNTWKIHLLNHMIVRVPYNIICHWGLQFIIVCEKQWKYMCLHFLPFLITEVANWYHGEWCPGDTKSQGISSHSIDLVCLVFSEFKHQKGQVKRLQWQFALYAVVSFHVSVIVVWFLPVLFQYKEHLNGLGISILKIRWSWDHLIL